MKQRNLDEITHPPILFMKFLTETYDSHLFNTTLSSSLLAIFRNKCITRKTAKQTIRIIARMVSLARLRSKVICDRNLFFTHESIARHYIFVNRNIYNYFIK